MSGFPRAIVVAALTVAALAVATLSPRETSAQPAANATSGASVDVSIAGAGDDAPALDDTIRELAARLRVSIDGRGDVLARVQVDLTSPREAVIVVTDGRTGNVVLRRSVPRDASPAIVREEIAHTVQSAIESELLAEEDRRRAPPPPPPAPPQERKRRSPFALDATTLAGAGLVASDIGPVFRFGGGLSLGYRRGMRPSIAATVHYVVPFDAGTEIVAPHVQMVSARGYAKIEALHTSWLALGIGAGGGFDVVNVEPRSIDLPSTALGPATMRTDPIASGIVDASFAITPDVAVSLAAGLDVDVSTRRYVIDHGAAPPENVFSLWRARPVLLAGFTFTAAGQGVFAAPEAPP